jgi:hypothetical protein
MCREKETRGRAVGGIKRRKAGVGWREVIREVSKRRPPPPRISVLR